MIFLFLLFIEIINICNSQSSTGTTLFYNKSIDIDCWTEDDLAKLRARMIFNGLVPHKLTPDKINKKYIEDAIAYYQRALRTVDSREYSQTNNILKQSLIDTIGGHLRNELLPNARFAYYAGYVPYRKVKDLHVFYEELKTILNTQGQGWKRPVRVPQLANLTVVKILIGPGKFGNPCNCLLIQRDDNSCIHIPVPRVDDDSEPSAIALPFKNGGFLNIQSPKSEYILLKYYTTAARCILNRSPKSCRHSDFVNFNNDLWHWMKRDVAPHLMDERLYAAYGGILRIAAAVQSYGKGLSRRNLFEFYPSSEVTKWKPWKGLTQSYVYMNTDWSPAICVTLVVLAALTIYVLQFVFSYIFGKANGCSCTDTKQSVSREVEYANIDSNFPAILPRSDTYCSKSRGKVSQRRSTFVGTVNTQRVYDLNEDTEKLMDVVMSDAEGETYSSSESNGEESNEKDADNYDINAEDGQSPRHPPKIESSISQLKTNNGGVRPPRYSSSTVRVSGRAAGWRWSSSSGSSPSSASSSSRDLDWARRVASSHSHHSLTKTTTATEHNSYTTPASHR